MGTVGGGAAYDGDVTAAVGALGDRDRGFLLPRNLIVIHIIYVKWINM